MTILGSGIDAINLNFSSQNKLNLNENEIKNVEIDLIDVGIYQPRKTNKISSESIKDLVDSVREHGILQPLILRFISSKRYELIAGERRLKAAITLGFKEIPAVIKKISSQEAFALALIENIQREQLSILEEAEALLRLKDDFLMSVESVALTIGKPRTSIANLIRLASDLSVLGKELLDQGVVDYGHVRSVLALEDEVQNLVLNYVVENKLTVRETEKFIREKKYEKISQNSSLGFNDKNFYLLDELDYIVKNVSGKFDTNARFKILASGAIRISLDFVDIDSIKKIL